MTLARESRIFSGKCNDNCLIIPVLNEGSRLHNLLDSCRKLQTSSLVDIIVADGGSSDNTTAEQIMIDSDVRGVLFLSGKKGLSTQLRNAFSWALAEGYENILTIDGNGKDDPFYIPAFLALLNQGYDFVQGSRFIDGGSHKNTPAMREFAIRYIHAPLLSFFSGFRWTDTTQGFRAYSSRLISDNEVGVFRDVFVGYELLFYLSYIAPRLGFKCVEVPNCRTYPQGEIPTKIDGFRGNLKILTQLTGVCIGRYNNRSEENID